jgi:mRNA-degrading endonuclease RelE of RelBE toxin-antitoxin system
VNAINWTPQAAKQLRKLDHARQIEIRDEINRLATMPNCQNIKSLSGHQYGYRLRVGNYRVLFNWDSAIKIVEIEEVKKRDERTYQHSDHQGAGRRTRFRRHSLR